MAKQITIDPDKTYTKQEYSRAYSISRPTIDKQIQTKELDAITVKGATLIIAKKG